MSDPFRLPDRKPAAGPAQVRVLALTGGGYRGLYSIAVLAAIERSLDHPGAAGTRTSIGDRFDLIVGTSIGAILGCALSCGVPAARLVEVMKEHGPRIFPALRWKGLRKLLGGAPYSTAPLRAAIDACIGPGRSGRPLAGHDRALVVTAVDWTTSSLRLLGSKASGQGDELGLTLMDALLASAAAPLHFPAHEAGGCRFVDGGLAANAPDVQALRVAALRWPAADIRMLSIGTANPLTGRDPDRMPRRGVGWLGPIVDLCMQAQARQAVEECERLLGPDRYLRVDARPGDRQAAKVALDLATPASTEILLALARQSGDALSAPEQRGRLLAMV